MGKAQVVESLSTKCKAPSIAKTRQDFFSNL
jgi:hypothetical protein